VKAKYKVIWLIPHIFLILLNIGVLMFIVRFWDELGSINRRGIFLVSWFAFTAVLVFGTIRLRRFFRDDRNQAGQ